MDADQTLAPSDDFRYLVFGGILGNVPSDDRTSEIRKFQFPQRRNLGPIQMTTNTAVLVAKLILEDKTALTEIPFVDEPEIPTGPKETTTLPFRYVASSHATGQKSDSDTPILPDGMVEYLKESLKANKSDLERERQVNAAIKEKRPVAVLATGSEKVRRGSTDHLHHHCPPKDKAAASVKREMGEKVKRKDYELKLLKEEIKSKADEISHLTSRLTIVENGQPK